MLKYIRLEEAIHLHIIKLEADLLDLTKLLRISDMERTKKDYGNQVGSETEDIK